jgi:ABC-type nickel/cobalt efflux system permease component RcnA
MSHYLIAFLDDFIWVLATVEIPFVHLICKQYREFMYRMTDSLRRRQSQQSFNTLTPFSFLFYSLHVLAPTGHPQV